MVSALLGTTTAIVMAKLLLREQITKMEFLGMVITLLGALGFVGSGNYSLETSTYAVIAGLCQGLSFTLTRRNTLNEISPVGVISSNYIFGGGLIGTWLIIIAPSQTFTTVWFLSSETYALALIVLVAQASLFYMMKNSSVKKKFNSLNF